MICVVMQVWSGNVNQNTSLWRHHLVCFFSRLHIPETTEKSALTYQNNDIIRNYAAGFLSSHKYFSTFVLSLFLSLCRASKTFDDTYDALERNSNLHTFERRCLENLFLARERKQEEEKQNDRDAVRAEKRRRRRRRKTSPLLLLLFL